MIMTFSENTTVEETLKKSRSAIKIFGKYNLYCPDCKGKKEDTLKIVALNNGIDIKTFLRELNNTKRK
jgi:hypothetical protein